MPRSGWRSRWFTLVLSTWTIGCGTLADTAAPLFTPSGGYGRTGPHVYGGVTLDAHWIGDGQVWWVLDLPFSLVADTLLFPVTSVLWLKRRSRTRHQLP